LNKLIGEKNNVLNFKINLNYITFHTPYDKIFTFFKVPKM